MLLNTLNKDYAVRVAVDGLSALRVVNQNLLDMILLDVAGSTGFCGSINASEQEENIFEFSAKFMYIATINENNLVYSQYPELFSR